MHPKLLPRIFAVSLGLAVAGVSTAGAQLYWDTNGATAGSTAGAVSGAWDTATANWSPDANGAVATQAWVNGSNAVFSAGTNATGLQTVTVTGAISANSITIEEGSVSLAGAAAPSLTIGNGGVT